MAGQTTPIFVYHTLKRNQREEALAENMAWYFVCAEWLEGEKTPGMLECKNMDVLKYRTGVFVQINHKWTPRKYFYPYSRLISLNEC